jgi:hypothetical protein
MRFPLLFSFLLPTGHKQAIYTFSTWTETILIFVNNML